METSTFLRNIPLPVCSYKDQMNMLAEALQSQKQEQEIRSKAQARVSCPFCTVWICHFVSCHRHTGPHG